MGTAIEPALQDFSPPPGVTRGSAPLLEIFQTEGVDGRVKPGQGE